MSEKYKYRSIQEEILIILEERGFITIELLAKKFPNLDNAALRRALFLLEENHLICQGYISITK